MKHIHRLLKCMPLGFTYNYTLNTMHLFLKDGECCDMRGAIIFAQSFDEDAKTIMTYSGSKPDTAYVFYDEDDDAWISVLPEDHKDYSLNPMVLE